MSESSSADERLHRLEEDGDAVQVVTVHRAKGLEFDFVYCPYLWSVLSDARVTDRLLIRRDNGWVLADGTQRDNQTEHRASTAERLRENVRLAYVALTRARSPRDAARRPPWATPQGRHCPRPPSTGCCGPTNRSTAWKTGTRT